MIYLNHAQASIMSDATIQAISSYLKAESSIGAYYARDKYAPQIEECYALLAALLGDVGAENISIAHSASNAWIRAMRSLRWRSGDIVCYSGTSYGNNYLNLRDLEKSHGLELRCIPQYENGDLDLAAAEKMLEGARVLCLTHIPSQNGIINETKALNDTLLKNGTFLVLDGAQSTGHIPINLMDLNCAVFVGTSRKYLRGPRGLGFLYTNAAWRAASENGQKDLGNSVLNADNQFVSLLDRTMYEGWEKSFALIMGLRQALLELQQRGIQETWTCIQRNSQYIRAAVQSSARVQLADTGALQSGIITFQHRDYSTKEVVGKLMEKDIYTKVVPPSAGPVEMKNRGIKTLVRASVHYDNTAEELERFVQELVSM